VQASSNTDEQVATRRLGVGARGAGLPLWLTLVAVIDAVA
jgi:hypothetical protein